MMTLTVDPKQFDNDPEKAFLWVTQKHFISRLFQTLDVKRWVWVLEFQKNGFPHWHVLIDKPGDWLDLKAAWESWGWNREGWKIGGVDLGRQTFDDARHAIRYITKYLTKHPKQGYPAWVMDLERRIRWVGSSKAVGSIVTDKKTEPEPTPQPEEPSVTEEEKQDEEPENTSPHRTLRARQARCDETVEFMHECVNIETGQITYQFLTSMKKNSFEDAVSQGAISVYLDEETGRSYISKSAWNNGPPSCNTGGKFTPVLYP